MEKQLARFWIPGQAFGLPGMTSRSHLFSENSISRHFETSDDGGVQ
jgi:hypothetical protein